MREPGEENILGRAIYIQWCAGADSSHLEKTDLFKFQEFFNPVDIVLGAWNQPCWEYLHIGNQQTLQIKLWPIALAVAF